MPHTPRPRPLLAVALALVAALAAPGCSDPADDGAEPVVVVRDLTGDLRLDLTYPDDPAFLHLDVYVGYTPASLALEDFGTTTTARATLTLVHPGGEVPLPVLFRAVDLTPNTVLADGTEQRMLLDGAESLHVADLSQYCDVAPLSLRVVVTVDDCGCSGTLEAPVTLVCDADRRGDAYLALTSSRPPAGRPCRAEDASDLAFGDVREFGWDPDGNHLFTDLFIGDDWVERHAYAYDAIGNLVRDVLVSPQDHEVYQVTSYTWDVDGRLASVTRRDTHPPYDVASRFYHPDGDSDWNTTDILGSLHEIGDWSAADGALTITADGESISYTFGRAFSRESWLGQTDVNRYHKLHVLTATDAHGARAWTWDGERITGDVIEAAGVEKQTTWTYDCP